MRVSSLAQWGRTAGVALFAFGILPLTAAGQPGGDLVFVGDAEPSGDGLSLPSLPTPPRAGGDPRYVPKSLVQAPQGPVSARRVPRPVASRSGAPSRRGAAAFRDSRGDSQRKGLLARFLSRGDDEQPAPPEPKQLIAGSPAATQPSELQLTGFYDAQRGRALQTTPGGRRPQGLFGSGGNRPQPAAASNRTAQRKNPRRQPSTQVARSSRQPRQPQLNRGVANRAPQFAEPDDQDIVFIEDEPAGPATVVSDQLPKPQTVAQRTSLPKPKPMATPLPSSKAAAPAGKPKPLISSVKPAPLTIENPAAAETRPIKLAPRRMAGKSRRNAATKVATAPKPTLNAPKAAPLVEPKQLVVNPAPKKPEGKQPSPRAISLLVEANQEAGRAATEQEFSRIVQRCRHVMAIDSSEQAIEYSRQLASWALNKRGELKADEGLHREAMTDFADALEMDPSRWRATHNQGVLFAQAGKFAEAFDAFNATIDANPKYAKAYSNRAALYIQAGDFLAAAEDYSRAIAVNPDLAVAHKGLGRVYHMLGRLELSLQHLDAAVLLSPQDASTATCRADLLVDMGRYSDASNAYQQSISLDPELPDAYRNLAWMQATCPDSRYRNGLQAAQNAQRALELLGEEDDISLDTLAAAKAAAGDYDGAVETIKRAMAIADENDQSIYGERLALYESGEPFFSVPVEDVRQAGFETDRK